MLKPALIGQIVVVLFLAAASAWLGQSWRREAVEYEAEKAKRGGIEKQRLLSEGDKKKDETIAQYEAEAVEVKGLVEGQAQADSRVIEETGETEKVEKLNVQTKSMSYATDALNGVSMAANRFARLSAAGGEQAETYRTISAYLTRTATIHHKIQAEANGGSDSTCEEAVANSVSLAHVLMTRIKDGEQFFKKRDPD